VFAALLAALVSTTSFHLTLGLLVAVGATLIVFGVSANTTVQLLTPQPLRGRVMSLYMICYLGAPSLGASLTGVLAEARSIRAALLSEAVIVAVGLGLCIALLHRRLAHAPAAASRDRA
jgi:hypothetical protein